MNPKGERWEMGEKDLDDMRLDDFTRRVVAHQDIQRMSNDVEPFDYVHSTEPATIPVPRAEPATIPAPSRAA